MKPKISLLLLLGLAGSAGLASIIHPFGRIESPASSSPLLAGATIDPPVLGIVSQSCQNCHSEKTEWPVYSHIAPLSWMIEKDVHDARSHMNLSRWSEYDPDRRRQILSEIAALVRNHAMPPRRYLLLHPDARLSDPQTNELYKWAKAERKRLTQLGSKYNVETSTLVR